MPANDGEDGCVFWSGGASLMDPVEECAGVVANLAEADDEGGSLVDCSEGHMYIRHSSKLHPTEYHALYLSSVSQLRQRGDTVLGNTKFRSQMRNLKI